MKKKVEKNIERLRYQSIYVVYEKSRQREFRVIDLHYLFLDEAEEAIYIVINAIKNAMVSITKKGYFKLEVIVGKGMHSKGMPVLFPNIKRWLENNEHRIIAAGEGKILADIKV